MSPLSNAAVSTLAAGPSAAPWRADLGDGTYRNPILHADYSDPDAIRVGNDFWMVSSSFSHVPGLPILHSHDLVNWSLVGHALPRLVPEDTFATPQPGKGVWAPALRYHDSRFWIYYPDPDFGIYVLTATDPRGLWSAPVRVKSGQGLIDPCPLWDDDGSVYLIHGWARSRAGFANVLTLLRLSADGMRVEEDLGVIIDGNQLPGYTALEGPKLYKRDGWYYVFAPAGGVKTGWQSVFRARSLSGPYESRIVLAQGSTPVNGPHQGALVDTPAGEEWFLHFQDKEAYGRIVHLQPVIWKDGWPVIGADADNDGTGEPVLTFRKPKIGPGSDAGPAELTTQAGRSDVGGTPMPRRTGASPASSWNSAQHPSIPTSDEFDAPQLGLQWQWQANPRDDWFSLTARPGWLRLFTQPMPSGNLYDAPHLLMQKLPAAEFNVTAELDAALHHPGDFSGLTVFGSDYAWIGVRGRHVVYTVAKTADRQPACEEIVVEQPVYSPVLLRVTVTERARCQFAYSVDGSCFLELGAPFMAQPSRWVGAKVGIFAIGGPKSTADWSFIRVEPAP